MEDNGGVRPTHYIIAEEILEQQLGRTAGARHNWRIGLADLATTFIDLLSDLPHRGRGKISDILRAVLIERGRSQSPAGLSRAARRCTTAAEESCTTGTMRKD